MFRSVSTGQSSASSAGHGGTPPGLDNQESPWIGLFSVLSRPALSLLNRILPGRTQTAALLDRGSSGWLNGVLDDGSYLRAEEGGAAALLDAGPNSCLRWLPADMEGLGDLGHLEGLEDLSQLGDLDLGQQSQLKSLSMVRTRLHQVLHSSQNLGARGAKDWGPSRGTNWWGDLCAGDGASDGALLQHILWMEPAARTSWMGPGDPGLLSDLRPLGSRTDMDPHDSAPPTLDQDHGYSSLEEEQVYKGPPLMATPPSEAAPQQEAPEETEASEEEEEVVEAPHCQNRAIAFIMGCPCSDDDQSDSSEDDRGFDSDGSSASSDSSSDSDQEEEEEEEELEEEEEMDEESKRLWNSMSRSLDPYNPQNFCACLQTGISSSSSLPRDIPATSSSPSSTSLPRDIPATSFSPQDSPAPSPSSSLPLNSPATSPSSTSLPLDVPATSSPPDCASSWDDSASEVDETENLLLWSSFSCSLDPYSPLNFQAPLRTRAPPAAPLRTRSSPTASPRAGVHNKKSPPASPPRHPAAPPQYRKEEAEERLDSGFSELFTTSSSSSHRCRVIKKVRFSEHVEEFFASGGEEEERRGPWEELARDRCRFMRRCLEVEQSISFCLQEQHRQDVYQRLVANQNSPSAASQNSPLAAED